MSRLKRTTLLTVPLFVMVSLVAGAMPAQAVCSTGVMCIWQDINYMNTKGTFTGDNSDWNSDFSPQNFWGDSVSSAFADISTHVLAMYQNIDGKYGQDSSHQTRTSWYVWTTTSTAQTQVTSSTSQIHRTAFSPTVPSTTKPVPTSFSKEALRGATCLTKE